MKQVRINVFETNSSSMHSLQLRGDDNWDMPRVSPKDGVLRIEGGEFGWGYDKLTTPMKKLSYIMVELITIEDDGYGSDLWKEMEEAVRNRIPEVKKIRFGESNNDYFPTGYIDHQSLGLIVDEMRKNNYTFEEIIFNDKFVIIIDNDNH